VVRSIDEQCLNGSPVADDPDVQHRRKGRPAPLGVVVQRDRERLLARGVYDEIVARKRIQDLQRVETKKRLGVSIVPRFFTQGSDAYSLMNRRAWMPPQQIDLDDGIYLPMTFAKGAKPSQAATIFFAIVDEALKKLIECENWKEFIAKDTCARVVIDDCLHVDVPLYAIPDDQFGRLAKAAMDRAIVDSMDDIDFMSSRKLKVESWEELDSDKVLLAHRKDIRSQLPHVDVGSRPISFDARF
jgi:hypothetical protein